MCAYWMVWWVDKFYIGHPSSKNNWKSQSKIKEGPECNKSQDSLICSVNKYRNDYFDVVSSKLCFLFLFKISYLTLISIIIGKYLWIMYILYSQCFHAWAENPQLLSKMSDTQNHKPKITTKLMSINKFKNQSIHKTKKSLNKINSLLIAMIIKIERT